MTLNIFDDVSKSVQKQEKADQASYKCLSVLRTVSKVLGGVLHHSEGLSPDELETYSEAMLKQIGEQTSALYEKLDMPAENFALASITGSVAQVISEHYRRVGPKALEMKWADTLAMAAGMEGVWQEHKLPNEGGSLEMRRSLAMMEALSPVISAYQRFGYFHPDEKAVLSHVGELIWHTTHDSVQNSPIASEMSEKEREMLHANLLRRAGELYADSWDSQAAIVMATYKESPADQRRVWMVEGYPLDGVDSRFMGQYRMLEQAMDVSLQVHSGIDTDETDSLHASPM
ncbi:hypothetical protein [Marinobacter subterrani]|uniref:hypothetical protein n=1 Tax=Marinobacter subterrani TaxID=1658765 RepID=UPI002352A65D|nr:hypothetical protein [Marinobacter subterrani]